MSAAVNGMASSALVPSATAGSAGGGGDQANGIERLRELEAMFLGGPVNAIDSKLNEVRMLGLSMKKTFASILFIEKMKCGYFYVITLYFFKNVLT